jgi:hypothetical protein
MKIWMAERVTVSLTARIPKVINCSLSLNSLIFIHIRILTISCQLQVSLFISTPPPRSSHTYLTFVHFFVSFTNRMRMGDSNIRVRGMRDGPFTTYPQQKI